MPFIPLLASVAAFGLLLGSKFFSLFALTLILQQVQIVGIGGAAQSLVNLTAGIELSGGDCGDFLNSANNTIRSPDIAKNAALLLLLVTRFKVGGAVFTVGVFLMLPFVIVLAYVLRHTARGGTFMPQAMIPRRSGVNVKWTLILVYAVARLICGLAGWALIFGISALGLRSMGAEAQWTCLLVGALTIGTVAVDKRIRKVAA